MTFASVATSISLWSQRTQPVLRASQAWEQNAVFEPTVLKTKTGYRMWYTGGWVNPATGTATSRDGIHWTKYSANPVLPGSARSTVLRVGSKYWIYYVNIGVVGNSLQLATSPDGIHWTPHGGVFPTPAWAVAVDNTFVMREATGWTMVYDAVVGGLGENMGYRMGVARSSDGVHWVDSGNPLNLGTQPTIGAPALEKRNGVYRLFFLAGGGPTSTVLPTDIYYAQSRDLVHWTTPTMTLTRSEPWEFDQVADPFVIGKRMWFAGCDNPEEFCAIGTAVS